MLRKCEICGNLFNACALPTDVQCDYCANNDNDYDEEYNRDALLAQQELEDFENHYGPCDDYSEYEDSYLDAQYEAQNEYFDYGGEA